MKNFTRPHAHTPYQPLAVSLSAGRGEGGGRRGGGGGGKKEEREDQKREGKKTENEQRSRESEEEEARSRRHEEGDKKEKEREEVEEREEVRSSSYEYSDEEEEEDGQKDRRKPSEPAFPPKQAKQLHLKGKAAAKPLRRRGGKGSFCEICWRRPEGGAAGMQAHQRGLYCLQWRMKAERPRATWPQLRELAEAEQQRLEKEWLDQQKGNQDHEDSDSSDEQEQKEKEPLKGEERKETRGRRKEKKKKNKKERSPPRDRSRSRRRRRRRSPSRDGGDKIRVVTALFQTALREVSSW